MPKQFNVTATESSKCPRCSVFPEKGAGRSVRYDRRVRNAEAAGSNPARSTFTPAAPFLSHSNISGDFRTKKAGKSGRNHKRLQQKAKTPCKKHRH